jgi:hypothetical protein
MAPISGERTSSQLANPLLSVLAELHHSVDPQTEPQPPPFLRFSPTSPDLPTRVLPRQAAAHSTSTIPAIYGNPSSTDTGEVVGITLGSVIGFLLLLYLVYTCLNTNNPNGDTLAESEVVSVGTASVVRERSRSRHHKHRRHSPRRETVEIRTRGVGGPVIVEDRRGGSRVREVRVEETARYGGVPVVGRSASVARSVSRGPPPPRVVRSDDEDDEIVVMEERAPPRKHRSSRRRSEERGGRYREVETDDVVMREVRRDSRRR